MATSKMYSIHTHLIDNNIDKFEFRYYLGHGKTVSREGPLHFGLVWVV